MIGQAVSHYRILEKIGEGGMGEVYLAEDTSLDRKVALKFLPASVADDAIAHRRFLREAKSAAALDHPFICNIHEVAKTDDGQDFICMEYVEGQTLKDRMIESPFPLDQALRVASEVAEALEEAHEKGIIHRDIKPTNIMLTPKGHAKVMDFGLAKKVVTEEGVKQDIASALTRQGSTVGTLAYMSPEQVKAQPVDQSSDIFSFGVVLYEMLTGVHPFRKAHQAETIAAILDQEPALLSRYTEDVPDLLQYTLAKMLAKDPDNRYQSLHEIRTDLAAVRRGLPGLEAAHKSWLKSWPVTGLVAAVVILTFTVVWLYLQSPSSETPSASLTPVPLTSYPGEEMEPSLSPDGRQVAFSWNGEGQENSDIYVKLVGPGEPLRLTKDPKKDYSPAWSPDGHTIAFLREISLGKAEVLLIPALGGTERKLTETYAFSQWAKVTPYVAWSPNGKWLVITDKGSPEEPYSLVLFSIETREKRKLTTPPVGSTGDGSPAFSPNGNRLAFSRMFGTGVRELHVLSLSADLTPIGEAEQITFLRRRSECPVWMPDGREIIFCSRTSESSGLWRMIADGSGSPQRLAYVGEGATHVSVAPRSSRLVYAREISDTNIWRVPLSGPGEAQGPPVRFISSTRPELEPAYSSDGRRIAFHSNRSGSPEIWVCDSDGSNPLRVTSFEGPLTGTPRWSPDGQRIAFDSREEGNGNIYVVDAQGGEPRRLTSDRADEATPSWSRDGKWIYFGSRGPTGPQVWKVPFEGGEATQITRQQGGWCPSESPDGQWVYYAKVGETISLWKVPTDGGEETLVVEPLSMVINYAVVDEGIYFIPGATADQGYFIEFFHFATGDAKRVTAIGNASYGFAVSPDGRSILYVQRDQESQDLMLVENFR